MLDSSSKATKTSESAGSDIIPGFKIDNSPDPVSVPCRSESEQVQRGFDISTTTEAINKIRDQNTRISFQPGGTEANEKRDVQSCEQYPEEVEEDQSSIVIKRTENRAIHKSEPDALNMEKATPRRTVLHVGTCSSVTTGSENTIIESTASFMRNEGSAVKCEAVEESNLDSEPVVAKSLSAFGNETSDVVEPSVPSDRNMQKEHVRETSIEVATNFVNTEKISGPTDETPEPPETKDSETCPIIPSNSDPEEGFEAVRTSRIDSVPEDYVLTPGEVTLFNRII